MLTTKIALAFDIGDKVRVCSCSDMVREKYVGLVGTVKEVRVRRVLDVTFKDGYSSGRVPGWGHPEYWVQFDDVEPPRMNFDGHNLALLDADKPTADQMSIDD